MSTQRVVSSIDVVRGETEEASHDFIWGQCVMCVCTLQTTDYTSLSSQHNLDGKYLVDSNLPQTEGPEERREMQKNGGKLSKDVQIL